jgi:predicted esterase
MNNMSDLTFTNIINKGLEMYRDERFWDAYLFMTENADHEPRNDAQVYDFRASLACRSGRPELGLRLLSEAVQDKGCWYSQEYLTKDEDIRPARELPGFPPLLNICAERERQARSQSANDLLLVKGERGPRGPLIIVLHGNMQNILIAREDWRGADPDLVFIQSSQIAFSDAYVWKDLDRGVEDVRSRWKELWSSGEMDGREVIIAGFSAGARMVLHLVLNGLVNVDAMVLVGPWLPEMEKWGPLIREAGDRMPGAHIVIGDRDEECLPMAMTLHDAFRDAEVPSSIQVIEGMGHDYPSGFGAGVLPSTRQVMRSTEWRGRTRS